MKNFISWSICPISNELEDFFVGAKPGEFIHAEPDCSIIKYANGRTISASNVDIIRRVEDGFVVSFYDDETEKYTYLHTDKPMELFAAKKITKNSEIFSILASANAEPVDMLEDWTISYEWMVKFEDRIEDFFTNQFVANFIKFALGKRDSLRMDNNAFRDGNRRECFYCFAYATCYGNRPKYYSPRGFIRRGEKAFVLCDGFGAIPVNMDRCALFSNQRRIVEYCLT